jgi:sRNA-binding carbon storage regulator CsrA
MRKHNGMRPQDIAILLKICALNNTTWKTTDLAKQLSISQSEISESIHRSQIAQLIDSQKRTILKTNFLEFLEYGIKYVFPQAPGPLTRGIPTAHSHPFFKNKILSQTSFVWPDPQAKHIGIEIQPLFKTAVNAVKIDDELYTLLALVDVIRVGKAREVKLAKEELRTRILHESSRKSNKTKNSTSRVERTTI